MARNLVICEEAECDEEQDDLSTVLQEEFGDGGIGLAATGLRLAVDRYYSSNESPLAGRKGTKLCAYVRRGY